MNPLLLLLLLAGDPASCPMHAQHTAAAQHHERVDERGDHVMGFSHEATKHTFRLLADGGAIEVRANDAADAKSISLIRTHLQMIAREFAAGEFAKPRAIHARNPPGVDVMEQRRQSISYTYEELELGARVRVKTSDASALDAVHAFLRFQIEDHRTGDSLEVE
jgi:hypothetical protein